MARLQILELPEGSNDDRPPFVLVVDQASEDIAKALTPTEREDVSYATAIKRLTGLSLAEQIGARAVLVFEETIDIPANDTSAYLAPPAAKQELVVKLNGDPEAVRSAIADDMQKMRDANEETPAKPCRDWCCSLAFQTLGKQHIDDCRQGNPQP